MTGRLSVLPGLGKCDSQKGSNGGTTSICLDMGGERIGKGELWEVGGGVKVEPRGGPQEGANGKPWDLVELGRLDCGQIKRLSRCLAAGLLIRIMLASRSTLSYRQNPVSVRYFTVFLPGQYGQRSREASTSLLTGLPDRTGRPDFERAESWSASFFF